MPQGIAAQSIGGLSIAGQAIAAAGSQSQGYTAMYTPGSYSFTPPRAGYYKFVLWGGGGGVGSAISGCSGAYCEITKFLSAANVVALVCGDSLAGFDGQDSSVTFPSGLVVTAGGGKANNGTPGVATNGDVNLNGSAAGVAGLGSGGGAQHSGGGGAPAVLPFRGGDGSDGANHFSGLAPGGGCTGLSAGNYAAAPGMIIVTFVRP